MDCRFILHHKKEFLKMKNTIIIIAIVVSLTGCSKIKTGKIIDGINTAIDVAELVCGAAALFPDAPPAVEKCADYIDKAAKLKQDDRVVPFVKAAKCVDKYQDDADKTALGQCVDDIDGWKVIVEELKL
jgi:hypothetical protein